MNVVISKQMEPSGNASGRKWSNKKTINNKKKKKKKEKVEKEKEKETKNSRW